MNPTKREIGRGAYGRVFEVEHEKTCYAAKELHTVLLQYAQKEGLQKIKANFLNECYIWGLLEHPCIVQFIGKIASYHINNKNLDGANFHGLQWNLLSCDAVIIKIPYIMKLLSQKTFAIFSEANSVLVQQKP